jgi:hypothetical protein
MSYTYYISTDNKSSWVQFYPSSKNKLTASPEQNEMFKRWKIDEIKIDGLRNSVYTTLAANFDDTTKFGSFLYFKIQRNGVDSFYFKCSINDCKLDKQNKIFYCEPTPDDGYELVLKGYNLVKTTPVLSTFHYPTLQDATYFIDGTGGIPPVYEDVDHIVNWENTTADVKTASYVLGGNYTEGHKIIVILADVANTLGAGGAAPVLDARTAGGVLASNQVNITTDGKYYLTITSAGTATQLRVSQDGGGAGDSGTFTYSIYTPVSKSDGYLLRSVITDFLGNTFLNTGLTPKSTILWNDALPSVKPPNIDTYITANPANDYVLESAAIWNYIMLAKTDAITGETATKYEITFKELMDILKYKMRIYWYIDSDGDFRLEHEKYFADFASQVNLTTYFKPEVDRLVYNYDKSNIYAQVIYGEANEGSEDWLVPIMEYDTTKTTQNTLEITPPKLSTDIKHIDDNKTSADSSGYMLLQCISQATKTPLVDVNESVLTADAYYPNLYLSWAWLIKNYFTYFGEADEATIHITDTLSLDGVKRFKKQTGVKFWYDGILNLFRPVTLTGGTAWMDKVEIDLESGYYTIDVGFDPY